MGAMEKHAFLIIAHTDWSLLKTLVSLLDYELNDIYIHIDAKVPAKAIPDIICSKSNLYMLEHRISVAWGDISVVEAEYLLFEIAYNNSHYGYYHLLSGVDLPLKSKEYIYSFFMQSGKEFIGFCPYNDTLSDIRVRTYHFFVSKMRNNRFYRLLDRIIAKCLVVFDCLRNKEIYFRKGSTWVSVTNDFVRYMLANKTIVLELYKHTFGADEFFIQTLCWNSRFRNSVYDLNDEYNGCQRLIDWERGWPYTWQEKDYNELIASEYLFARKFSSENAELIYRLTTFLNTQN